MAVPQCIWQPIVRKASAFLYCACMCCHNRFLKENPADIELYEMTYFLCTHCRKATVFSSLSPFSVFSPLNVTGRVLKVVDLC